MRFEVISIIEPVIKALMSYGHIYTSSHKSQLQITYLAHYLGMILKCLTNYYSQHADTGPWNITLLPPFSEYKRLQFIGQDNLTQQHRYQGSCETTTSQESFLNKILYYKKEYYIFITYISSLKLNLIGSNRLHSCRALSLIIIGRVM